MSDTKAAPGLSNLAVRILAALVLAPVALAATYGGGVFFSLFFAAAACAVLWEWFWLVRGAAHNRAIWTLAGIAYAGVLFLAPISLRGDPQFGFAAIVFVFGVVWATDVFAYFAGRAFGGPKLAPSISPNKTWSGACGGTASALLVAAVTAHYVQSSTAALVGVAFAMSAVSQIGDLAESALKRKFGAKDAGRLIPGHGGVMDRLDGFWAAALLALIIGASRAGMDAPARGLLVW